jgi:hypothetical protein
VRACSAGRGTIEPEVEGFPKSLSPKGRLGLRIVRQAAGTQRLRSEYFGYFGFFVAAEIFSYEIAMRETGLKYERLSNRPPGKAEMSYVLLDVIKPTKKIIKNSTKSFFINHWK